MSLVLLVVLLQGANTSVWAEDKTIDELVFESSRGGLTTTLTLALDEPITASEAKGIRDSAELSGETVEAQAELNLSCGENYTEYTSEGRVDLQYACFSDHAVTQWSFRLSSSVKAIIVSPVTEDGLRWWRNGWGQSKNARHVEGKDYIFHGTMKKMWNGDRIEYQDYLTFRHNIGGGGGGSVAFAGTYTVG